MVHENALDASHTDAPPTGPTIGELAHTIDSNIDRSIGIVNRLDEWYKNLPKIIRTVVDAIENGLAISIVLISLSCIFMGFLVYDLFGMNIKQVNKINVQANTIVVVVSMFFYLASLGLSSYGLARGFKKSKLAERTLYNFVSLCIFGFISAVFVVYSLSVIKNTQDGKMSYVF